MKTEKVNKNKRMSLDPAKNQPINSAALKNHMSELQVRQNTPQESQSTIYNHHEQNYSNQDVDYDLMQLEKTFNAISQGKDEIVVDDLYVILKEEGYNDCLYSAVDMIALVDETRKGYITRKQFMKYFSNKVYVDEEKIPPLTPEMIQRKKWMKYIDENFNEMKDFANKDYCNWVCEKIKEYQHQRNNNLSK